MYPNPPPSAHAGVLFAGSTSRPSIPRMRGGEVGESRSPERCARVTVSWCARGGKRERKESYLQRLPIFVDEHLRLVVAEAEVLSPPGDGARRGGRVGREGEVVEKAATAEEEQGFSGSSGRGRAQRGSPRRDLNRLGDLERDGLADLLLVLDFDNKSMRNPNASVDSLERRRPNEVVRRKASDGAVGVLLSWLKPSERQRVDNGPALGGSL